MWAVEKLIALLPEIAKLGRENRELADSALRAISTALDETSIYTKRLRLGSDRDLEIEEQLAKYWSAAAIPMRHLDAELAEICTYKSEYWIDPEAWEESNEVAMDLNYVRVLYREKISS